MFFIVAPVTGGLAWFVWFHNLSNRIGDGLNFYGRYPLVTAFDFWVWDVLGSLIVVGPFIYHYKLLHAMNRLGARYNMGLAGFYNYG